MSKLLQIAVETNDYDLETIESLVHSNDLEDALSYYFQGDLNELDDYLISLDY